MKDIIDKAFLFSSETQQQLEQLREKAEHFDAWDFGARVSPIVGAQPTPKHPHFLGRLPMSHIKKPEDLWMITLKEVVQVDRGLVQQKVLADVLHGAEHNKNWKDWANVQDMDSPKASVPTITEDDFYVWKGTAGSSKASGGGKFGSVSLDCSGDKGLYTLVLGIKKTWIKDAMWNAIQEAITVAGAAMYKSVATNLATEYASDASATESFDTDLYQTLANAVASIRGNGFEADIVLVDPAQEADLMGLDTFINIDKLGRVGRLAEEGTIGSLYGRIPVFSSSVIGANPIVAAKMKGEVIGLRQDIALEEYDDPIKSLEGAVLTMRYDIAKAFAKAIIKCATS